MGPGHPIATFQRYASPLQAARVQVDLRNVEAEGLTVRPVRTSLAPQKPKAQPFKTQAVPCPPLTAASVPVMPKGSVAAAWLAKGTPVPATVGAGGSGSCSCSFRGVPVPKQRGVRVAPPVKHAGVQAAQFMLAFMLHHRFQFMLAFMCHHHFPHRFQFMLCTFRHSLLRHLKTGLERMEATSPRRNGLVWDLHHQALLMRFLNFQSSCCGSCCGSCCFLKQFHVNH